MHRVSIVNVYLRGCRSYHALGPGLEPLLASRANVLSSSERAIVSISG